MTELAAVVRQALDGDMDSFGVIIHQFQNMAYGYAFSILGDFHLAQDAAQEAFVEAHRRLDQLREPDAFPGWLRRIVFKQCDRLIRRKRVPIVPLESVAAPTTDLPGPDRVLEEREMKDEVLALIKALPEQERMATTLFYMGGYSQNEVAAFLEVPVTTVKNRLYSSRKKLKEQMMNKVDETLKSCPLPERFADVVLQMHFVTERINPLAEKMRKLSAEEMAGRSRELREHLAGGENRDTIKAVAFALVREATGRAHGWPHYDVQLAASMILDEGWVAESRVGEGKTISCFPAIYMAVLEGRHVHVATVNDYLAQRDAGLARKVFSLLDVSVGCIASGMPFSDDRSERTEAYRCDVTYGCYTDFAFDHLVDNLHKGVSVQPSLEFAVIDEIDSVLVDEAGTEIIIHGGECSLKPDETEMLHLQRDRDYLVDDGKVIAIDRCHGRIRGAVRFSDGVQQTVEAREGVEQTPSHRALGSITLGDFFQKYDKLAGVTGTASSKAKSFKRGYGLSVARIPTRRQPSRVDHKDRVYPDNESRNEALMMEIRRYSRDLHRPVLVACTGLLESEAVSRLLAEKGIEHQLLNARPENTAREGDVVARMGRQVPSPEGPLMGMVTVATNMAGRGTDIRVSAGAFCEACKDPSGAVKCCVSCLAYDPTSDCAHCFKPKRDHDFPKRGLENCRKEIPCGLHVIGVGRHADRSIDDQLRLRAGRQGEPGSSRFLVSKDDRCFSREATYCIARCVS